MFNNLLNWMETRAKRRAFTARELQRPNLNLECLEDRVTPATIVVDSTDDNFTVDGMVTLREAIKAANTNASVDGSAAGDADGDIIIFDATKFAPGTITLDAALGDLLILDDVTIDGINGKGGKTEVTIDGDVMSRHFHIDTTAAPIGSVNNVNFKGMTLENGDGTGNVAGFDGLGGSIYLTSGETVTLTDTTIRANKAALSGGGIFSPNSTLTLENVTLGGKGFVDGNEAEGTAATNGGGGLYVVGGTTTITDSTIQFNNALMGKGSGGGVLVNGGKVTATGGSFQNNNSARAGGGIEINSGTTDATVDLVNVDFLNNGTGAMPGNGGGLHISDPTGGSTSKVSVTGGRFTNNFASAEGGGLWNAEGSTLTISGTTISANSADGADADQGGGGVFNDGGTVMITNATIVGNGATGTKGSGGGILNDGGTLTIMGGSISGNDAIRAGGGIEVTTANSRDSKVTLTNVSVSGNAVGNGPGNGGGVHISDPTGGNTSTFDVTGGTVSNNIANQEGGGLWNDAGGTLTISGTTISGNVANAANAASDDQGGGGVFNTGGTVTIMNATISGNSVNGPLGTDDGGGGVFNRDGGTITIMNTMINDNTANAGKGNGGGILNIGTGSKTEVTGGTISGNSVARAGGGIENNAGVVTLSGTTLSGNNAGINGGGVHLSGAATFTATNTTFTKNNADNEGGGLWNSMSGSASIILNSSTVDNNTAKFGGGLFNDGADGTITLTNTTVSGNESTMTGGGIDSEGGTVTLNNSTIANNKAGTDGGGLNVQAGTANATNTIIGDNTAAGTGADVAGALTANFSLIESTAGATISGSNNLNVDPLLGPLQDNGGPTLTHLPLPGSPVRNAGDPNFTPPPDLDQRGQARVQQGRIDIGAVEGFGPAGPIQLFAVGTDAGSDSVVRVYNADGTLRFELMPHAPGFTGGVRVATGDINGDGIEDIVTAAGPGGGPLISIFNGTDGSLINRFTVFGTFNGGLYVAVGDTDNDGFGDVIVGAGAGGGPRVAIFSGAGKGTLADFFAYDPAFAGGVTVAAGDFDGDGFADLITGAGPGGGPHVQVFSGAGKGTLASFFVFSASFTGGVFVGSGDVDADNSADLIVGMGAGEGSQALVRAFSGSGKGTLATYVAYEGFTGGVRVASVDRDADGDDDILTGPGPTGGPDIRLTAINPLTEVDQFFAFAGDFFDGVFVG